MTPGDAIYAALLLAVIVYLVWSLGGTLPPGSSG